MMLRRYSIQLQLLARQIVAVTPHYYEMKKIGTFPTLKCSKAEEVVLRSELNAHFFYKNIGSTYTKWQAIVNKHPELRSLKSKDVINTINSLRQLNFSLDDVLAKPMILYTNQHTIENRYSVFKECGIENITMSLLYKYVAVMNKSVADLKTFGHIPHNFDVIMQLLRTFTDIQLELSTNYPCDESLELKTLRQRILNHYFQQRLGMSPKEIEKIWASYYRVRHKSFRSVQDIVKVLIDELKFPKERIIKNAFILCGDADNVRRIIKEIPTIYDQDMKEILFRKPKIMMSSCDSLLETLNHIKSFGISEKAVFKCLEVLTLGPSTVLERLKEMNEIEQFQVLSTNPRVLRLVHYQNKARLRLDYLNQLKVRCASLHILSCGSRAFAKFALDGSDRTKGCDCVVYLSNKLKKPESDVRNILSRHPNWCHIPVLQVKHCYEFLLDYKFSNNDIYNNLHLILYPIKRIEEKLLQLRNSKFLEDLQINQAYKDLENKKILTLALYLIESEFHFTGDGIWTDQNAQHIENFNNLLPDFPEILKKTTNKYSRKPPEIANLSADESTATL